MVNRLQGVFFVLALLLSSSIHAQYASPDEAESVTAAAKQKAAQKARETYLGRKFWIVPNPKAILRREFRPAEEDGSIGQDTFVVTETTSFTVAAVGIFDSHRYEHLVKVVFADGKAAYLRENRLFAENPNEEAIFDEIYIVGSGRQDLFEYLYSSSPEQIRIAEQKLRKKAAAAAAAWKARGGVRLGMTAAQVRASNWGKPRRINRTTGAYGVHEQWVYGDGNYIYLENGVVTSVQN